MNELESPKNPRADSFRDFAIGPWRVVICDHLAESFRARAHAIDFAARRDATSLGVENPSVSGRARNVLIQLPNQRDRLHLRPLRHGGILAPITGDRFAGLERPLAELRLTADLVQRHAPVARPAFVVGRRAGLFWHASFASVHIEDSLDGVAFMDAKPDTSTLERVARASGTAIRRLHDLGCCHADLHVKNLLVRESESEVQVTIIDLDRAKSTNAVSAGRRAHELMRLRRSLIKRGYTNALLPGVTRAFTDAYVGTDVALRDQLLARGRVEQFRSRAHSMFYRAP